jgi:RNA polymerase sigma factor (sigma-70 family)
MDYQQDFRELMRQVQTGSPEAARRLCDQYGSHVMRVIRRRLPDYLRPRYDSIDFQQDVWASFFAQLAEHHRFDDPSALIAYLSRLAQNKVLMEQRRGLAAKRDVWRDRAMQPQAAAGETMTEVQPDPRAHTPSLWMMADERWEQMLAAQPPLKRRMLLMLREGCSHGEVAAQLGLHPKAIQRVLRRLVRDYEP